MQDYPQLWESGETSSNAIPITSPSLILAIGILSCHLFLHQARAKFLHFFFLGQWCYRTRLSSFSIFEDIRWYLSTHTSFFFFNLYHRDITQGERGGKRTSQCPLLSTHPEICFLFPLQSCPGCYNKNAIDCRAYKQQRFISPKRDPRARVRWRPASWFKTAVFSLCPHLAEGPAKNQMFPSAFLWNVHHSNHQN